MVISIIGIKKFFQLLRKLNVIKNGVYIFDDLTLSIQYLIERFKTTFNLTNVDDELILQFLTPDMISDFLMLEDIGVYKIVQTDDLINEEIYVIVDNLLEFDEDELLEVIIDLENMFDYLF